MTLFAGLKVIDCASWIAGPAAATMLSDFGADVIKIEPPGAGDPWRGSTPIPGKKTDYYWQLTSRNKRSLALDLKHPDGQAVLHRLVSEADVFITNFPLPVRDRLRLADADLMPLNSRLIYASFTAYGEKGEEAAKTGFDSTAYWARTVAVDAGNGRFPECDRCLFRDRDGVVSPGEDRSGQRGAYLAVAERAVGERLRGANAFVRGGCGAAPASRRRAQCAGESLSIPRWPLVHHGVVQ